MKNSIITFLFSAISFFSIAQPVFNDKMFNDIIKRFETDPKKYLSTETAPDFMFVGTGGYVSELQGFVALYDIYKPISYVTSDVKIRQYSNTSVVTGRMKHSYTNIKTGAPRVVDELFTYTYVQNKGNWQFVSAQHGEAPIDKKQEEATIKKMLDDETIAYHTADKEAFLAFWKDDPKTFFTWSGADGSYFNLDNAGIKKAVADFKPSGSTAVKTNHRINIKGNMAVADFDQVTKQKDGSKGLQHNVYLFEKMGGAWKFVGASLHGLPSEEDKPEEIVKQWIMEYNKDGKSFFENNCSDDYIASNTGINGGKFFGKESIVNRAREENQANDAEVTNMKTFKSGNLAVIVSNLTWHHKQADGTDKPDKTVSTWVLQKKEGKWWYAGHHISPLKE